MQGDYSYYNYPPNPNPSTNPNPPPPHDPNPFQYASAPPYSTNYTPTSDYSQYSQNYRPYHENPDPTTVTTPTAPSYASPPTQTPNSLSSFPPFESHAPQVPCQPPQQSQQNYYSPPTAANTSHAPYDQGLAPPSYAPSTIPEPMPNSTPNLDYSSMYGSSAPYNTPAYEPPYDNSAKFDRGGGSGYLENRYDGSSSGRRSVYGANSDPYGKRSDSFYGDGVYAYDGGKAEPYGARGTASKSSTWSSNSFTFDDYGRRIGSGSGKESSGSVSSQPKIVRAAPKVESQQDVKGGVQKFRVKLLAESGGQSTMDVLCQIGLDGIRMLDPSTSRTLRIYPLETITRCEVSDPSTLAFWSKSSVDIEARRIRLQSNSYTTNTLLDIVTAATVQLKEMGGRIRPPDFSKMTEQPTEKKKGLADWMNFIKPGNEEKDHWVPDEAVSKCTACGTDFGAFVRKHHCRNCGDIFCDKCTSGRIALTADDNAQPVRVCDRCLAEVTQRLSNAKEAANRPVVQSHEDLAKKLHEEMERNRKGSSGFQSDASGRRMREVACPICTVHLQVQVPTSGSETIECGVCQNPFLVSAH